MKLKAIILVSAALVFPAAASAADDHSHHQMKPVSAKTADVIWADGTIKKVDKKSGMVTIAHGPLENLGMSAMTMAFGVKDKAWLGKLKAGDRIRFVADYVDGAMVVTRYEPAR